MANRPVKPHITPEEKMPCDVTPLLQPGNDTSEQVELDRFEIYGDGRTLVDSVMLNTYTTMGGGSEGSRLFVSELFAGASVFPEVARNRSDEFIDKLGHFIQPDNERTQRPLSVEHGVRLPDSDEERSILFIPSKSCDQFAGMFCANLTWLNGEEDVNIIRSIAMQCFLDAGYLLATFDYYISRRWLAGSCLDDEYKRGARAAKKIVGQIIGSQDIPSMDFDQIGMQIAANFAYTRMINRLSGESAFGNDPGMNNIANNKTKLCLRAYRATGDEFFVWMASPLGKEFERAYLQAAIDQTMPKPVN